MENDHFFIKYDKKFIRINFCDIIYIEGARNYIKIVTDKKNYLSMVSMKNVELILPASLFIRIHKSFIISIDRLIEFDSQSVTLNAHVLPIGTQYKAELRKKLLIAEKILPVSKKSTKLPVAGMT